MCKVFGFGENKGVGFAGGNGFAVGVFFGHDIEAGIVDDVADVLHDVCAFCIACVVLVVCGRVVARVVMCIDSTFSVESRSLLTQFLEFDIGGVMSGSRESFQDVGFGETVWKLFELVISF